MKKVLLFMAVLCVSAPRVSSQVVLPLKESAPLHKKLDIGLQVGLYPFLGDINEGNARLFLNDPYGNFGEIQFKSHNIAVDVPVNLKLGMLVLSGSAGIKWLGYTPSERKISSAYADKTITYPSGFSNGYLSSFWGTCSVAMGIEKLKMGVSFDFLLGASKKGNPDNSFLFIGENSYSKVVPAVFVEAGFLTAHFRYALRMGFETRSHLDAISLYRTTGQQQLHVDGGLSPILGLMVTYKIYSSYGKYRVFYY